jgi:uncharacterized protein (DUF1330 family)
MKSFITALILTTFSFSSLAAPGYFIAEFEVLDPEGVKPYLAGAPATIKQYGGEFIIQGGDPVPLEGGKPTAVGVIKFESLEKAKAWYNSPEYTKVRKYREKAMNVRAYLTEGTEEKQKNTKKNPGYVIAEFELLDAEAAKPYRAEAGNTVAKYGGEYVARRAQIVPLEGEAPKGLAIIRFESKEKAKTWYDSPEYSKIRPIRQKSMKSRIYILGGI